MHKFMSSGTVEDSHLQNLWVFYKTVIYGIQRYSTVAKGKLGLWLKKKKSSCVLVNDKPRGELALICYHPHCHAF